jgi:hypothetical protein
VQAHLVPDCELAAAPWTWAISRNQTQDVLRDIPKMNGEFSDGAGASPDASGPLWFALRVHGPARRE